MVREPDWNLAPPAVEDVVGADPVVGERPRALRPPRNTERRT